MPYQRVLSVNSCFAETNRFALPVITYYSVPQATAFTCSILLCCHKDLLDGCLSLSSIPSMLPAVKRANVYYALPLLVLTLGVVRFVELLPASCIYKQSRSPLSLPLLSPRCSTLLKLRCLTHTTVRSWLLQSPDLLLSSLELYSLKCTAYSNYSNYSHKPPVSPVVFTLL